ncbi:baeRF3 domain-containing protein [Streptacidiphilus carbonis]|uniref:baeRF3 domain-containing protein n=1 Tax=Streptacidiphilus carbonis TaxID=105422 RepID=UPI0005AA1F0D|nr:hypothetical protein [Streptacidiphilus carbonis]
MDPVLNASVLAELRRPRRYPAVSVLVPTHRREPDNAQDPVRLRNLVAEAKERLQSDPEVSRADRIDVTEQLDRAVAEVDLVHAKDGLVIFAAPGEHQVWKLGRPVPARVVLAETFVTRNLVSAHIAEQPYWVLAVAADHVSLWNGVLDRLTEHRADGFPLTRSLEDPDSERKERIGDLPSTFRDEQTRQFLRQAAEAASPVLEANRRPLFLVGEAAALSLLVEAANGSVPTAFGKAVHITQGGLAKGPGQALYKAVGPVLERRQRQHVSELLSALDQARSRREFAAGLDEVWTNVTQGRIASLSVEENFRSAVLDGGEHLVPADSLAESDAPARHEAREDIVDEIIERALDTGAEVSFVPDDSLTRMEHIAAVLRY